MYVDDFVMVGVGHIFKFLIYILYSPYVGKVLGLIAKNVLIFLTFVAGAEFGSGIFKAPKSNNQTAILITGIFYL